MKKLGPEQQRMLKISASMKKLRLEHRILNIK